MKVSFANGMGEFISFKLKNFYNKKGIKIKFRVAYIYSELFARQPKRQNGLDPFARQFV